MNWEDIRELTHKLITAKKPDWSERVKKQQLDSACAAVRDYIRDMVKFKQLIKGLIENPSFRFSIANYVDVIKKNQVEERQYNDFRGKANFEDFKPYIYGYVRVSLSTEFDVESFSRYLANNQLIEYKSASGQTLTRHLTRSEYEYISNERVTFRDGVGGALLPYPDARVFKEKSVQIVPPEQVIQDFNFAPVEF